MSGPIWTQTAPRWITRAGPSRARETPCPAIPAKSRGDGADVQAATFCREAFLRSCGSRKRLRRRIDLGVTSTISSSSM